MSAIVIRNSVIVRIILDWRAFLSTTLTTFTLPSSVSSFETSIIKLTAIHGSSLKCVVIMHAFLSSIDTVSFQ